MRLPPPSDIASRPIPNHVNPKTRGNIGEVVGLLLAGLVTVTLAIRLYVRKWLTRRLALDDVFILLAYLPTIAYTIIGIISEDRLHWNRHTWDLEISSLAPGLKLIFANGMLFVLATSFTKLSILTIPYRLTTASKDRKMTIAVSISMAFIGLSCFAFVMVNIFQCTPLSHFWETTKPGYCIDQNAHMRVVNIFDTMTDWLVVLLPLKVALGLNLPAKQISMLMFLFGVGVLASLAGIARSYFAWMLIPGHDPVWHAWSVWFCSTLELNLGIICASIPATKPFFASYLPNVFETAFRQRRFMAVDWDRKRLAQSSSLTTFIDESSSSSSLLPQRPLPLLPHHPHADLNRPLPPIVSHRHADIEAQSLLSDESGFHPWSPQVTSPQRARVRFSDHYRGPAPSSSQPRDRSTIFIMYRADNESAPMQQMSTRASLA
ncbi:hypothetical protein F4804DRAFT_332081 [Jackrogersella minutella]|nr:hypothetical protein F4804DRAFT_332081 [Jackrogersella minutella]